MARDVSGSWRDFQINGISYRPVGDGNATENFSGFENSLIANSGKPMRKMVKRITSRESVVLNVNAAEKEQIKLFSESLEDLELSYTNAAGDVYSCVGNIEVEGNETEDNRTTLQLLNSSDWVLFEG